MPFCTECGTQVADSAKFCQHCGNPMGGSQAVDPPAPVDSELLHSYIESLSVKAPEADSPTLVDSEPVSSETETSLGGSQAEDPPTPVDSEPVRSEPPIRREPKTSCLSRMIGLFKAFILLCGLLVLAAIVWDENAYAGLVVGLIYLVVPGVAIFKPIPKIWLGHRGLNFCIAFIGVVYILASIGILGEESPNQSATTRSIGAVTSLTSTPTSTPTLTPTPTPTATPTFAVYGGLHATMPSSTPTATFTPTTTSTSAPTATPTPTRTSTPVPTATPTVTATPTPAPLVMQIGALLNEYTQNKVRANARLRYLENGEIPVTITGYVSEVEELYVDIKPRQSNWELSYRGVNCYYTNVAAALQLTKGQWVSISGKISGVDSYSQIAVFECEIEGLSLPTLPIVPAQVVRKNTVQVFCTAQSLFGTTGYKGTGVIIDPRAGLILTVHHVIDNDCERIAVKIPGVAERVPASINKHCASIDRAQLRIPPQVLTGLRLQPILRAAAPAQKDQEVYFWGFGTGELRLETGVVTSVSSFFGDSTSTDAHAIPGDSGSPVYNEYGHLLGTMSRSNFSDRAVYTGKEC